MRGPAEKKRFNDVHEKFVNDAGDELRQLISRRIEELKVLRLGSGSLGIEQYILEIARLDFPLGEKVLGGYVKRFAQVEDRETGLKLRALLEAATVLSIHKDTKALLLDKKELTIEPIPMAARRLHDGLLGLPPGPEELLILRENLRGFVIDAMVNHAAWPLLVELASLAGQEIEVKLAKADDGSDRLENFADIADRFYYRVPENALVRANEILTELAATEGSNILFRLEKEPVEEPGQDAG